MGSSFYGKGVLFMGLSSFYGSSFYGIEFFLWERS